MKRKQSKTKSKQKKDPVFNVDEVIQNVVRATANTHEWALNDNDEVEEVLDFQTVEKSSKMLNQKSSGQNIGVESTLKDSTSPLVESDCRITRSKSMNTSRGLSPFGSRAQQEQGERSQEKEPMPPHPNLLYKDQELKASLEVIRKVMEMDAAAPFNLPVDPVALGIPDYLDVIEKPMDFSTMCNNLENGHRYQTSEDVYRDVQYIWENCTKYYRKGHYVLELMKRVKNKFMLLWTETGLFTEHQPEIHGYSHLPTSKSAETRSINGYNGSLGNDCAKTSQNNQVEPSRHQSRHSSLRYPYSYQSQRSTYDSPPSFPEPSASRNIDRLEAARRRNPSENQYQIDATDSISTHTQFQHQHQFSMGNCKSHQPHQEPCNVYPMHDQSQHSYQLGRRSIATAATEHSHLPPPRESSARRTEISESQGRQYHMNHSPENHRQQYQTQKRSFQHITSYGRDPIAEFDITDGGYSAHQHHDEPSCCYGHQQQPQVRTCSDMLSSRKQHTSSNKPHAGIEIGNADEEFQPPPLAETMIRYTKRGPIKYPFGHLDDHQRQDKKAARLPLSRQPSLNCSQMERGGVKRSFSQVHATSDEPHADVDMYSSDDFLSPPHAESRTRSKKQRPTTDPDSIIHQQRDNVFSGQMQTEKGPSGQPSSGQPQPSYPQAHLDTSIEGTGMVRKKTQVRGPTRCLDVWKSDYKMPVRTNEFGEPVGPGAPKFIRFLGTIARNGRVAPLNYIHWRAMPDGNKDIMWQLVESKFIIDPQHKDSILKSIGSKWKNWKAVLKAQYYTPHETDEERLADCDERVLPDQWRILVSFWNSDEAKDKSNTNKAVRSRYSSNHACGPKSFAQVREEQRMKRPGGEEPSQADLFIATRTRKNGQPVNEASSVVISELREAALEQGKSEKDTIGDDVFSKVMGEGKRPPGVGITLSKLVTSKPLPSEAVRMVSEAKDEVSEMRGKMVAVEQTCAQMAAQIATMMTMMQKKFCEENTPNVDASRNSERSVNSLSSI